MKTERIKKLLERYLEAQTSGEEEKELSLFFRTAEALPPEWEVYRSLFNEEEALRNFTSAKLEDDQWLFGKITEEADQKGKQRFLFPNWAKNLAAGIVLLGCGVVIGQMIQVHKVNSSSNEEVAALRDDLLEVRKMLLVNMLQQPRASQRIQAVYSAQEMNLADESLISALTEVLQQDENVNVRLTALHALSKYARSASVRKMLLVEMVKQDEPLVQLSIMELMVELNEKSAIQPLQKLTENDEIPASVREEAEMSLQHLL